VSLFTAGALSGAGAFVSLSTIQNLAQILIDTDATVTSKGDIEMEAQGATDVFLHSLSETYGFATVAVGDAIIEIKPENRIDVMGDGEDAGTDGAYLLAEGNLYLSTGTDKNLTIASHSLEARVDNFAGSAIPIDDLETRAIYLVDNIIEIHTGATIESYRNIDLNAEEIGLASVVGMAKGVNWASAAGDAINRALAATPKPSAPARDWPTPTAR